jgi:hypothetical protein
MKRKREQPVPALNAAVAYCRVSTEERTSAGEELSAQSATLLAAVAQLGSMMELTASIARQNTSAEPRKYRPEKKTTDSSPECRAPVSDRQVLISGVCCNLKGRLCALATSSSYHPAKWMPTRNPDVTQPAG